jgi:hypothetical protein
MVIATDDRVRVVDPDTSTEVCWRSVLTAGPCLLSV